MRISDWSSDVCSSDLVTRRYRKPDWNIDEVLISGHAVPVEPEVVRSRLFCDLLHFKRGEVAGRHDRSEEHTSELQSLMRISYAVFCLKKKKTNNAKIEKQDKMNKQI